MRFLVLLRGVNVGGAHRMPMAELKEVMAGLGCGGVVTHIQSGNAVYEAPAALAKDLPARLEAALRGRFGFEAPVVQRSAREWGEALAARPFPGADPAHRHIGFLKEAPAKAAADAAVRQAPRAPGEEVRVLGREVHLLLPHGVAGTKLTNAYFDSRLKTVCTLRNLRTVEALAALLQGAE